ncbi:MAG: cytochrome ubiquinol oxidase subunit I, partial [Bacilli bacterium]
MLEVLSRIQFAFTVAFHFIFVPLSIGLILLIAIFETLHYKKKNDEYRKLSDYFGNMFIVMYAVGIVTGIAMSLQFGTNWGAYSKFMGDVFGAPLALEALIAFFLESTFTGIYVFRRHNLSPKFRCVTAWLITFGTAISALWIITAAGFMHNPVGYKLAEDQSQVILVNIFSVLLNPYAWYM